MTLQQDNAWPHAARAVMGFLRPQNIQVMKWPAMSPDVAPIEHVSDEMYRRLLQGRNLPRTLRELGEALHVAEHPTYLLGGVYATAMCFLC